MLLIIWLIQYVLRHQLLFQVLCRLDFDFLFLNTSISIFGFLVFLEFSETFITLPAIRFHAVFACVKLIPIGLFIFILSIRT